MAEALPFETIPAEPLREHFTAWLVRSVARTARRTGVAEAPTTETERPRVHSKHSTNQRPRQKSGSGGAAPPPETIPAPARPPEGTAAVDRVADEPPPKRRAQFVRIGDKSVWLTKPMLRSRGWTDTSIRDYLPDAEGLKPNPRFAAFGAPMPVWRPATVAAAEAEPQWRAWLVRSLQRRRTTLEALAATDDQDFRHRLEAADEAIRSCHAPPTLI